MTRFGRQSVAEAKLSQSQPRPPRAFEVLPLFLGPWCYHVDKPGGPLQDETHGQALLPPRRVPTAGRVSEASGLTHQRPQTQERVQRTPAEPGPGKQ